jgi:hypothetical protein
VTNESCTKVADLGQRRYQKNQETVWHELVAAVAALKDAERHLLKAHIAMEGAKWHTHKVEDVRTWALWCQEAEEGSHNYLRLSGRWMGYDDPFSTESSG